MIAFGPVPSRRLGRSLGINNIPPKICSFACIYCQLGRTLQMRIERQAYYQPEQLFQTVWRKVERVRKSGQTIDYLTFVPDGEPTLDINLGKEIELLRKLDIKIAVITNSSLIGQSDVQEELLRADWVSVKIDSVVDKTWHKINRPHHTLQLKKVLAGVQKFASQFSNTLVTETMLVKGVNDGKNEIEQIADYIAGIKPSVAYLAIPTRPPAEDYAVSPPEEIINQDFHLFKQKVPQVELLIGYEGNAFAFTGNVEEDLLSITAVHPMRVDAVDSFLKRSGSDWSVVQQMIQQEKLLEATFEGNKFYLRKLDWHRKKN